MICLIAAAVVWVSIVIKADDIYCNASYECVGEFISNSGDGFVYSLGYKANYGSISSIYVTGTFQRAYIRGAFGAHQIGTLYNSIYYIHAQSVGAVMDATNVIDVYGASGTAASSLAGSQFLASLYFYCYSHRTCDGADITGGWRYLTNNGARSFSNAQLSSATGGSGLELEFRGYYAGYNTTITCNDGHSCDVKCYGNVDLATEAVNLLLVVTMMWILFAVVMQVAERKTRLVISLVVIFFVLVNLLVVLLVKLSAVITVLFIVVVDILVMQQVYLTQKNCTAIMRVVHTIIFMEYQIFM